VNRYRMTYKDLRQAEPSTLLVCVGAALALVVFWIVCIFVLSL